jgi:hypothetical protein
MSLHPIIAILLLAAALATFSCRQRSERPAERKAHARSEVQARIAELSAKYNADGQWQKPFDKPDKLFFYTVELQRALIRKDGRPLIFVATVDDVVVEADGRYVLQARLIVGLDREIHLQLRCGAHELGALLDRTPEILEQFAVVAHIQEVRKPLLQAVAQTGDERSTPEIVVEPSQVLLASGECLDAVYLGR